MNLAQDPESEERKALCAHTVDSWKAYVDCGALACVEREFGEMTEHEKHVFQSGWQIGFHAALLQGKVFFDFVDEYLEEEKK
jgi:hypothetical protein